jgi:hypothetical protein
MFSLATIKALQIYGIAIVISMVVAVLIKVLVVITSRVKRVAKVAVVTQKTAAAPAAAKAGIPDDVVAALSAAIAVIAGPHRILHIGESKRSWAHEGRIAQHSHQPRH